MVGTKPCGRLAESRESEPPSCAVRADSDSRQSQRLFPRVLRKRKPGHLHPVDTKLPYRWCPREGLAAPRRRSRVGQGRATFVWVSPPGWATPPHWEGLPGSEAQTRRSGSQSQRRAPKLARPPEPPSTSIARPQCTASPSRATPALAAATGGEAGDQTQASSSRAALPAAGQGGVHHAFCRARPDRVQRSLTLESTGRGPQRSDISHGPLCRGRHDSQAARTPLTAASALLTCLHRVREVVPGGRGPRKFLQLPSAEVQPPRVGGFLQCAF